MYFSSVILAASLMLLASPAYAFPVVLGGMASNILVLILSIFGVVKSKKEKNKGLITFFLILAGFLGYQSMQSSEVKNLALEHEYFPGELNADHPENIMLSDGIKALKNIRSGQADYIIASQSKTQYIPGSHIVYFADKKAISAFAKTTKKPIYVFSKLRSHGANVVSILNSSGNKMVAIVDSAFLFNNLSESHVLSENISEFTAIPNIEYQPIYPGYKSIYETLKSANQIVVTDNNQFKVHSFLNSFLLTPIDIAAMTDEDWKNLKSGLNPDLPTKISFSQDFGDNNIQALSKYIVGRLSLDPNKTKLSKTYSKKAGFTELSNDNQITPIFFRSNVWLDAVEVYGLPYSLDKSITIGCFTEQCVERIPPKGSGYTSRNLVKFNPFEMVNWQLKVSELPFGKNESILLSPEDSNSSLLSYYLAYELSERGYDFRGFIKSNNELFGASYFTGKTQGLGESIHIDSTKVSIFLAIHNAINFWDGLEPINVDNLTLVCIGAALGYLALLGGFYSFLSAGICAWLYAYFHSIFKMPISEYQYMIANPFLLSSLIMIYFIGEGGYKLVLNHKWKGLLILSLASLVLFEVMNFTPTPFDRIYLGSILFLIFGSIALKIIGKLMYLPARTGDKYRKTVPFLKKDSFIKQGFIVKPNTKNIPFLARLFGPEKWIIRSNHIISEEQSSAGIFESRVVKRSDLATAIKEMKLSLSESLKANQIQFWVMPYIKFKHKGVARSYAPESSFSISYSLDQDDLVTEGYSNHYNHFHRKMEKSMIEKRIMSLIEEVEAYYNKPVIIEFGVTKFKSIRLLQVRIDDQVHPAFDENILSLWRSGHRYAENIESSSLSPLGRSVLARLYSYSVIMDHEHVYRIKETDKRFQYMDAVNAFQTMKDIQKNIDFYINRQDFYSFVDMIAEVVEPVSNCITDHNLNKHHDGLSELMVEIYDFMQLTGGTIASMDITEPWRSVSLHVRATERDACKAVMMFAVVLCKYYYERSGLNIDKNLSLKSYIQGKDSEFLMEKSESNDGWIIVDGKMPAQYLGIDNYLDVPRSELKNYTLVVKSFPTSNMDMVSRFGGVISRDGSPMSHLAITAKNCKTPCRIGIRYFRKVEDKA